MQTLTLLVLEGEMINKHMQAFSVNTELRQLDLFSFQYIHSLLQPLQCTWFILSVSSTWLSPTHAVSLTLFRNSQASSFMLLQICSLPSLVSQLLWFNIVFLLKYTSFTLAMAFILLYVFIPFLNYLTYVNGIAYSLTMKRKVRHIQWDTFRTHVCFASYCYENQLIKRKSAQVILSN